MTITRQCIVSLMLLLMTPAVQATVVTWELNKVRFDDGGSASGFFTLDDQVPGFLTKFDITTTAGTTNPHFHYTPATTAGAVNSVFSTGILLGMGKVNQLELAATSPLLRKNDGQLVTGGTLLLDEDPSREFLFNDDIFRHVRTGSLSVVPEPSQIGFFMSGLLVLIGIGLVEKSR